MCLALKYMHEAGEKEGDRHMPVLHRDIKSQNIFLSKREGDRMSCVKIADFGIAKVLQTEKSLACTQVGTPYYLSPEICQKHPYGEPSDVWALGCVLYELCALRVPFEAQEIFMLFDKILRSPAPRIPSTYSRELSEIGLEMLSREAHRRPSAAMMLKKPILRAEIERMLAESRDRKFIRQRSIESAREDRRDSRDPGSARNGSQTPQRRPLGDHNPRSLPQTPQQRAGSKKRDSRAPSPTQEAAKQMLRPSRAPSPAREFPPVPAAGVPLSGRRHHLLR
jgi:serine/threonine protein kinase